MKKIVISIVLLLAIVGSTAAQTSVPQLVNFQAVARDASGNILASQNVLVRMTLREGSGTGTPLYCATHQALTNAYGSFSIQLNRNSLGTGCNSAPSIAFESIAWESGSKWVQIEYQPPGGVFTDLGAAELASSPFAFSARTSEKLKGVDLSGANDGQVLKYNATTQKWVPGDVSGGSSYVPGSGISITGNTIANTGDLSNTNEIQSLSLNGSQLSISGGNSVNIPASPWSSINSDIYNTNTGNVGIGLTNPSNKLDVAGGARFQFSGSATSCLIDGSSFAVRNTLANLNRISLGGSTDRYVQSYDAAGTWKTRIGVGEGETFGRFRAIGSTGVPTVDVSVRDVDFSKGALNVFNGAQNGVRLTITNGGSGIANWYGPNAALNVGISSLAANENYGFIAVANDAGTTKAGVYVDATGQGTVFGDVKNFRMAHPAQPGKEIWYASLEGPEAGAYVRGTANLVNGEASVVFSDDFQQVGNPTTMTVVLTPGSADSKGLAVVEKTAGGFKVKELLKGKGSYSFDWEVKAVRKGYENYRVIRDASECQPAKGSTESVKTTEKP